MKKVLLVAAVAVFGLNATAQEETTNGGFAQGDVFITGSVGYASHSSGDTEANHFEIAPSAGYFVSENIALGLRIGYMSDKSEVGNTTTEELSTLILGAFGRYYFMPADQFSIFGELGLNYLSVNNDIGGGEANGFGLALAPGISYFVSSNFALEARFGILGYQTVEPDGGESNDTFSFGVDMKDISLGIVYKF